MTKKTITKQDILFEIEDITKDYLDKGWHFNFTYMRVSNGTEFTAVTDGKDTVVIYLDFLYISSKNCRVLKVKKFAGSNNEHEDIFLSRGEVLSEKVFVQDDNTKDKYYQAESEAQVKKDSILSIEREINRHKTVVSVTSEGIRKALAAIVKKEAIPGLKRFDTDDLSASYVFSSNSYSITVKGKKLNYNRTTKEVTLR